MPRSRKRCYQCGRPREVAGIISTHGLCDDCAVANMRANWLALSGKWEGGRRYWEMQHAAGMRRFYLRAAARIQQESQEQ